VVIVDAVEIVVFAVPAKSRKEGSEIEPRDVAAAKETYQY
jgi:hypothetical protein